MTTDLEYVATGLAPGESVTIEVTADAANGCDDSGSIGTVTCNTEPCDFLEADLSSIPDQNLYFRRYRIRQPDRNYH